MKRLAPILSILNHYRHSITIIAGVIIVGFLDENSYMKYTQLRLKAGDLKEEIARYTAIHEANKKQLNELKHDGRAFGRIARERYFMKTDDEDIYVLSDDKRTNEERNEATE